MQSYIKNLRSRPESYRKKVLFGVSISVAFLLLAGFLSGLSTPIEEDREEQNGPLYIMKKSFDNIFDDIKSKKFLEQNGNEQNTQYDTKEESITETEIPFEENLEIDLGGGVYVEGVSN